jgi:hypothetical protein
VDDDRSSAKRKPEGTTAGLHTPMSNVTASTGVALKPFLEATSSRLAVAMFEFYADHIVKTMTRLGEDTDARLEMTLQSEYQRSRHRGNFDGELEADRLDFTRASISGPTCVQQLAPYEGSGA